jgi:hypothetical protein
LVNDGTGKKRKFQRIFKQKPRFTKLEGEKLKYAGHEQCEVSKIGTEDSEKLKVFGNSRVRTKDLSTTFSFFAPSSCDLIYEKSPHTKKKKLTRMEAAA